jgi:hypothetical protein
LRFDAAADGVPTLSQVKSKFATLKSKRPKLAPGARSESSRSASGGGVADTAVRKKKLLVSDIPEQWMNPRDVILDEYEHVLAVFGDGRWYPGTIEAVHAAPREVAYTYDIMYDDGDFEAAIPATKVVTTVGTQFSTAQIKTLCGYLRDDKHPLGSFGENDQLM